MCLAVPLKIIEIDGKNAVGERLGVRRRVRLDFTPAAQMGDYIIAHAGFAIEILPAGQAEASLAAIREVEDALETL